VDLIARRKMLSPAEGPSQYPVNNLRRDEFGLVATFVAPERSDPLSPDHDDLIGLHHDPFRLPQF